MDTSCSSQCHHACFSRYQRHNDLFSKFRTLTTIKTKSKITQVFNYIMLPQRYIFFYKNVSSQLKVALFHCAIAMSCLKRASQLVSLILLFGAYHEDGTHSRSH